MSQTSFIRHAAVYGAGNLLMYAAGFLLLPLYVRCLTEAEYGTLDLFNRLGEVVILCLLCNGLRQALFSFHNQCSDEQDQRAVIGTALLLTVLLLLLGGSTVLILAEPLSRLLRTGDPTLLRLAIVSVALESLALMLLALSQARVQSLFFTLVTLAQFLVRIGLTITFVAHLAWGIKGVLIASALTSGLFVLILLVRELLTGGLSIRASYFWPMMAFALPFVPGGLGFFVLHSGDRFFLLQHVSPEELGAYALGYKLALVVKLFSRRPLYMVWSAQMYRAARQSDAPIVFGRVFTRILAAYVFVGLALCLVQEEIVALLAGNGYTHAASIIAPVTLAYFFLTAADLMDAGFYIQRRTIWKTPITLASTVVMLSLYALLIPRFAIVGAALATMIGFLFHAFATAVISQRIFTVSYEWTRVASLLALAVSLWLCSRSLPVSPWMIPIKVLLFTVWPTLLWYMGVISREEKRWVSSFLHSIRDRLIPTPSRKAHSLSSTP